MFLKNLKWFIKINIGSWKMWYFTAFLAMSIVAISSIIAQVWIQAFGGELDKSSNLLLIWEAISKAIMIFLWFLVVFIFANWNKKEAISLKRWNIKKIIIYWVLSAIFFNIFMYIWEFIVPWVKTENEWWLKLMGFWNSKIWDIMLILTVTILAPIVEEILFRWIAFRSILSWLAKFKKIWINLAFIISTFIVSFSFGSIHLWEEQAIYFIVPYFVLALVFTYIYTKTDSIYTSIISHSLNNSIVVILMLLSLKNLTPTSNFVYFIAILAPIITFLIVYFIEKIFFKQTK